MVTIADKIGRGDNTPLKLADIIFEQILCTERVCNQQGYLVYLFYCNDAYLIHTPENLNDLVLF